MLVECDYCGRSFHRKRSWIAKVSHNFCSRKCMGLFLRGKFRCTNCGKSFYKPPSVIKNLKRPFCSPQCYGKWKYKESNFKKPNECPYEWGYILGILCSDGSKPAKFKRTMAVSLTCKDREMVQRFLQCIETVSSRKYSIQYSHIRSQWSVKVTYGKMVRFIESLGDFSWQKWYVPEIVMAGPFQIKKGFLNGFLDGDGSVTKTKYFPFLQFVSANHEGLKSLRKLLLTLGIQSKIHKHSKKYKILSINKKDMVLKYSNKIEITLKRKHEAFLKHWKEYEENVTYQFWSKSEEYYIRQNYTKSSPKEIAKKLGRPLKGIYGKAKALGLKRLKRWNNSEVKYLQKNYGKIHHLQVAKHLRRSPKSVMKKASELGLRSSLTNRNLDLDSSTL